MRRKCTQRSSKPPPRLAGNPPAACPRGAGGFCRSYGQNKRGRPLCRRGCGVRGWLRSSRQARKPDGTASKDARVKWLRWAGGLLSDDARRRENVRRMTESIAGINGMDRAAFVARFGGVFEHSPWVAGRAWERRPFRDRAALLAAMAACVREAGAEEQTALIRAHPDLVGRAAREGTAGGGVGVRTGGRGAGPARPGAGRVVRGTQPAYQERFGFPFIICVRANRRQAIMDGFATRLRNSPRTREAAALAEIEKIAAFRLADLVEMKRPPGQGVNGLPRALPWPPPGLRGCNPRPAAASGGRSSCRPCLARPSDAP